MVQPYGSDYTTLGSAPPRLQRGTLQQHKTKTQKVCTMHNSYKNIQKMKKKKNNYDMKLIKT